MIYRGPHEQDLPHFRDINSTDFRDIVDFLSVCQGHELQDVGYSHRSHRAHKLSFVHVFTKLFQDGSKFKLRRHFVPQDHPFVCEKGLSGDWGKKLQVGEHIDIPMYLVSPHDHLRSNMFLNTTSTSQSPDDPDFDENGLVLRRTFDPWDNATSSSTDLWEAGYGNLNQFSTVLVREDRMHLRIIDAKMIIKWVQRKIIPRMEGDLEPYRNAEGRPVFPSDRESHRLMNKWSFHQYWHEEERIRLESPEVLECGFQYAGYKRDTCQYDLAMYQKD
jgi:hypothetical protein